jgi:methionyl-tRNA synthetase
MLNLLRARERGPFSRRPRFQRSSYMKRLSWGISASRPLRAVISPSAKVAPSTRTVASRAGDDRFTITTPLYYANAEPHMGGAYSTIAADVIARFQRMQGKTVCFVTGTDEHGEKIAASAAKAGVSPKVHCDSIVKRYKDLWDRLGISYDRFVRTTDRKHEETVKALLETVWAAGHIYKGSYSGRYCVGCEEFKDADDLDEENKCLIHKTECPLREEDNYFFELSRHGDAIQAFVSNSTSVQPVRAANEVRQWIAEGCRDFSITRAAVDWGIRVPRDEKQTIYVWFDALIGYLSALLPEGTTATAETLQEHGWPAGVHIIGRDILRFHAVYWPGMLLSMGLPLPQRIFGHGFLTKDGLKMGKSLGNVLDPFELVDAYGADAVRVYFMKEIPFGQDGDFSELRFQESVNASLANNFGNLVNRCLNLLLKYCNSEMPVAALEASEDHPVRAAAADAVPAALNAYQELAIHDAVAAALSISARANQLLEDVAPWTALKKGDVEQKELAAVELVTALEGARIASVLLAPVTPALSARVYSQLGYSGSLEDIQWSEHTKWGMLQKGQTFPKPSPVFLRIESKLLLDRAAAVAA